MKKLTLIQRFSVLSFIILIIFGIVFGWIVTNSLEQNTLTRSIYLTANFVSAEVKNKFIASDLITPKYGSDYYTFLEITEHLNLGPNIERIKVWNGNLVIWSDDEQLVGQSFLDNEELSEALDGEIVSRLSFLNKDEQESEKESGRLLELYVPILFNGQKKIMTVFEIYQNLDPLYEDISNDNRIVWILTFLGFSLLYFALYGIILSASKQIQTQTYKIKKSGEKYRNLVQSNHDGIISVDLNGKVILFNKAAEEMFGYSFEEVAGQFLTILMPSQFRENHQTGINRFFQTGKTTIIGKSLEIEGLRKDGSLIPIELSLSVSGEGENLIVTGIVRDISERKAMIEQLINAEKQASISMVAGSIGHELNNAITGLVGYVELLKAKPDDRELTLKCLEVFNTESQRLTLHARNLLSLSKPRKPRMDLVYINKLLNKVTELLFTSGLLKFYSIVKDYSENLLPVLGDEMLIEQVIRNIEINAAHAMGNHGILTLQTKLSKEESFIEFSIIDTGHGIPNNKRRQIFLPFYTTKEKGKGTGLGMYIIKQIVEQHKGYINIESEVGVGTTVTIGLPTENK